MRKSKKKKKSLCLGQVYRGIRSPVFCEQVVYLGICPAAGHTPVKSKKRKSKQEKFVVLQDCCLFLQGNGKVYLAFTMH